VRIIGAALNERIQQTALPRDPLLTIDCEWWQGIVLVVFRLAYTRGSGDGSMHRFSAVPIAAVVVIAFGQTSNAADMPAKAPPPAITSLPLNNWTGFYVGGNVGGAWSTTDWTFFNGATFEPISQNASSWVAGGQIGYLHQFDRRWVAGLELSWSGTNLKTISVSDTVADRLRESKISDLLLLTGALVMPPTTGSVTSRADTRTHKLVSTRS
jgi:opacity protein-like surface antigen